MRKGFNPKRDKEILDGIFFHQVIIPVYIPNQEGYFTDCFAIFKYCLQSIFKTSHKKTFFTIVNNGSCKEVQLYLDDLFNSNLIHELIHTTNIGKLNAILKAISGNNFPLVTITDADVFFCDSWQQATYKVFEAFPKTGVVSTTPNSKGIRYYTSNVLLEKLCSKKLQFTKVVNPKAMRSFAESIGTPKLFNEYHLSKYLTISNGNDVAVVGAGHFSATYRGEIFSNLKKRNTIYSLGGTSENDILDKPVVEMGLWRLSTQDNFTYHMGNVKENWMEEKIKELNENTSTFDCPKNSNVSSNKFVIWFKINFFSRIIYNHFIWKIFLQFKGLSKKETNNY